MKKKINYIVEGPRYEGDSWNIIINSDTKEKSIIKVYVGYNYDSVLGRVITVNVR